ncbi:hypothetical protein [Kitasatospora sp. NPDC002965]|uniref:hypothetical protein n=1 Tax=Kitasatospora sp. NPDC002965 TaxID=3154775 RepID=UPI0033AC1190
MEFIDRDLELTRWSINPSLPVKGVMAPAKDNDMKSPSQKIVVTYPGTGSVKVYVLSGKP